MEQTRTSRPLENRPSARQMIRLGLRGFFSQVTLKMQAP